MKYGPEGVIEGFAVVSKVNQRVPGYKRPYYSASINRCSYP